MSNMRDVHPEEDPRGPTHRGTLYKKSKGLWGRGATWAPRMFVLEDRELTYHALAMGFGGEVMGEDAEVDIGVAFKASRSLGIARETSTEEVPPRNGPTHYRFRVAQNKQASPSTLGSG